MKEFIIYLWKNRLLPQKNLTTAAGERIEITSAGTGEDSGLFRNSKIKIDGTALQCDVEIVDAEQRGETTEITITADGTTLRIPITIPADLAADFQAMKKGCFKPPCERIAGAQSTITLHDYLTRLLVERIEEKAERIKKINEQCEQRWDFTLFKLLARSYGFGIQSRSFEEWAMILDMQALGKHRNSVEQIEAVMFGQAGLLEEDSIPAYYRDEAKTSEYYLALVREYKFLKSKFALPEMSHVGWNYGNSAPHIRIARLASLFHNERLGITTLAGCKTIEELRSLLQSQPSAYWQNRTQFGGTTTSGTTDLSDKQLDVLIINTVIPILYAYGKHRHDSELCGKAEDFLYEISAENNSVVRRWTQQGVCINSAADSQALIQLNNSYCKQHRCAECRFAHSYFKENLSTKNDTE